MGIDGPWLAAVAEVALPWADFYGGSTALQALVMFGHLGGLFVAGGLALASDRSAFRVLSRPGEVRHEYLLELNAVHKPIVMALGLTTLTGFALLLADVEVFLVSKLFWIKMGLLGLLILNAIALQRAERSLKDEPDNPQRWDHLKRGAGRSMALWGLLLLAGTLLPLLA